MDGSLISSGNVHHVCLKECGHTEEVSEQWMATGHGSTITVPKNHKSYGSKMPKLKKSHCFKFGSLVAIGQL